MSASYTLEKGEKEYEGIRVFDSRCIQKIFRNDVRFWATDPQRICIPYSKRIA